MQDHDSVKSELQTLIMLEQQQASALHSINNKAGFGGMPGTGFGMPGAGLYGPMYGGGMGHDISSAGFYKAGGDLYDRAVGGVINSINNVNANMRNFAMTANLDSANPMWLNQSKLSTEARQLKVSRSGERLTTGTMSALSGGIGLATTLAGAGIGGALGGAVLGAVVDIGADQLKQNYAYDQYLLQNSHRFINMMESNNMRGVGGFSRNERWETANFLRHFNTDMKISDDDTMTILKGFTEGDLLREAKDVDTFKQQMTKLTKSLKTMALTLNESYEEVAELMGEMKKKGIDTRNYEAYAAQSKVVGGLIGADAADTMQYQLNTASMLTSGTMMSTDRMMGTVGSAQAYMGKIYDEALANKGLSQEQALRYNRIVNRGGVDAATTDYLSATSDVLRSNNIMGFYGTAFFDWDGQNWNFNRGAFDEYTNGNYSMAQLQQISKTKLANSGNAGSSKWMNIGSELLENSLFDVSDRASLIKSWVNATRSANPSMQNMGDAEIMKYVLGMSGADSTFISDITNLIAQDGGAYYDKILSASVAQRMMDDLNSKRTGPGYAMKNWWSGVKDTTGDFFSPIAAGWNSMSEGLQDWWYGKEYYDVKKLWSGVDFTKDEKDYDYSKIVEALNTAAKNIGNSSDRTRTSLEKLAAALDYTADKAKAEPMIASQNGINNFNWGSLADWGEFKKGYSMWDGTTAKADYIQAALEAFNEAGGFGITGSIGGLYSERERKDILNNSLNKYKAIMEGGSVTKIDYDFAKAFEEYNLRAGEISGFGDIYYRKGLRDVNGSFIKGNGVDTKNLAFDPEKAKGDYSVKELENVIADIEETSEIEKAFSVAQAELGENTGTKSIGKYEFTRKNNGRWNIRYNKSAGFVKEGTSVYSNISADEFKTKLTSLYSVSGEIGRHKERFEAYKTGYTALAGMIGMSDADARGISNVFGDYIDRGTMEASRDKAEAILASNMFTNLSVNALVGDTAGLKDQILSQSWVGNLGGTQVVGNAIDSWMSSSGITTGSALTEDVLKDLVNQILNAATAGGAVTAAEKEDREKAQASDIKGIRDILYHKFIDGKGDGVNNKYEKGDKGYDIYENYENDRNNTSTDYGKRGNEVNINVNTGGNTGGNTQGSRLFR